MVQHKEVVPNLNKSTKANNQKSKYAAQIKVNMDVCQTTVLASLDTQKYAYCTDEVN